MKKIVASVILALSGSAFSGETVTLSCMDYVDLHASEESIVGTYTYYSLDYTVEKDAFETIELGSFLGMRRSAAIYNATEEDPTEITIQNAFLSSSRSAFQNITFANMELDGGFHFVAGLVPNLDASGLALYFFGCSTSMINPDEVESGISKLTSQIP